MNLTPEGVAMARELEYGHNPTAYSCGDRANNAPFDSDAVCIICSDGFEAMLWKRRAVKAEAELAAAQQIAAKMKQDLLALGPELLSIAEEGAALETTLARLRALHQREPMHGTRDYCRPCGSPWPCPTIRVLDAPEEQP